MIVVYNNLFKISQHIEKQIYQFEWLSLDWRNQIVNGILECIVTSLIISCNDTEIISNGKQN